MRIVDRVKECDDGLHQMRPDTRIEGITLHMFAVPGVHDVAGIARFYRANPQYTGGQMPYTYGIHEGLIEQALPIFEIGPHALRWSSPTVGVVWVGCDFNRRPPTPAEFNLGVDLVAELCGALELDPRGVANDEPVVAGHTERPRSTRHSGKVCPGELFDLDEFREAVRDVMRESAIQRLEAAIVAA